MGRARSLQIDDVGYWSEIKLDIIRRYAQAYSKILTAQKTPGFEHVYIDAFAGAGVHRSKQTGEEIPGSPQIAVATNPPFREYHFIDLDGARVDNLRTMFGNMTNVMVYQGDCNEIILKNILPRVRYGDFRRGMCLLDPYGLHLDWEVIAAAGQSRTLDVFLNFPIADMNRNVFWHDPTGVDPADVVRMNRFWGDETWREIVYAPEQTLFGQVDRKEPNETVAAAFRNRLQVEAKFKYVPEPIPMRNSQNAVVYYLYFASANNTAHDIVNDIFNRYRNWTAH